ncbi:MAG: tRNA (N6-threonylcarbamoyladenosine(37)-N6)-methyltransferase TrmO [Labilithrix sp.]|nr:tRNA (N6-threonylcarbamoyladenosine(37)-N6)-methyltransferase TrmO [Labilithrix sp.]
MTETYLVRPIGLVRSPFTEKVEAPRQAVAAESVAGRVEIFAEHEHALADLQGFDRLWILFWFHRAAPSASAKVLPPRSDRKRGVFATRSPHRPNPIGMSAVRLEKIEGLVLHVRDLDLLDGTPVLDLKPYLAYADAFPDASAGWLAADPRPVWEVRFAEPADAQLRWLDGRVDVDLRARITDALALGPQPHPYRRIKRRADGSLELAVKDWRVHFEATEATEARSITILRIATGWKSKALATGTDPALELHRAFVGRFG